eukprot:COSAG04_NODE_22584_length_352_cov_0.814229_1_plen_91_part_01
MDALTTGVQSTRGLSTFYLYLNPVDGWVALPHWPAPACSALPASVPRWACLAAPTLLPRMLGRTLLGMSSSRRIGQSLRVLGGASAATAAA